MQRHATSVSSSLLVILSSLVVLSLAAGQTSRTGQAGLPKKMADLSDLLRFTPAEVQALKAGEPVSKLLESSAEHEVAVAGAVWIDAPVRGYIAAMNDISHLEHGGGFQVTKRISNPPRLEDFANLELPADDVKDLRECGVGDCDVKLDENAINRIQKEIDWSKPTAAADVNALIRRIALEYVIAYQQGGNKKLPVYRDKDQPTYVAREFAEMVKEMPLLLQQEPALYRYLLDYPNAKLPNATSFFYWQKVDFGLKPVIRINHVVMTATAEHAIVASKQIYASHYFRTALEVRDLIPDPSRGDGFWFVNVSRGRAGSSLTGIKGRAIRGQVRKTALKGLNEGMQATKSALERKSR